MNIDLEREIEAEMHRVHMSVANGEISAEEGTQLIEELKEVYSALGDAEKEIAVRYAVQTIEFVSKFA